MFGKTRQGKSNVVKLIAQSLIDTSASTKDVGQLIFDINGEYANDNPQDGSLSLKSGNKDRCCVYALTKKESTDSKPLKLNFYEQPTGGISILGSLLRDKGRTSGYIEAFTSVALPSVDEVRQMPPDEITRPLRKLQVYWAILTKAGFTIDEKQLRDTAPTGSNASQFNPGFSDDLRKAAYEFAEEDVPDSPSTLGGLTAELEIIAKFRRERPTDKALKSKGASGKQVFEADDVALLEFLAPPAGRSGVSLLQPFRHYHDAKAGDFQAEILKLLDEGQTAILDLGNANPEVMTYFSNELSKAVFAHQVDKFSNNKLGDHFVQVYFEEAHNLFPKTESKPTIYTRFAKEGAKYHIGMVYSTQSPTTINHDLLAQTENFFIAHLSSQDEVNALAKMNVSFDGLQDDILKSSTRGYVRMLTRSHRFVIPVQAKKFEVKIAPEEKGNAVPNR